MRILCSSLHYYVNNKIIGMTEYDRRQAEHTLKFNKVAEFITLLLESELCYKEQKLLIKFKERKLNL